MSKKTFFILEDSKERMETFEKLFKKKYGDNFIIYSSDNVEKAKLLFANHFPYDTIFLDHDLEGKVYVSSKDSNTGYSFASWMKKNYPDRIKKQQIIVHSMNGVGAKNIKNILPNADIVPFNILIRVF